VAESQFARGCQWRVVARRELHHRKPLRSLQGQAQRYHPLLRVVLETVVLQEMHLQTHEHALLN